jgi:hypothetical protein
MIARFWISVYHSFTALWLHYSEYYLIGLRQLFVEGLFLGNPDTTQQSQHVEHF